MNKFSVQYAVKKDKYLICLSEEAGFINLANFRVVIKEEIRLHKVSGGSENFIKFDVYQAGKQVLNLNIPNVEFEQFKWVTSQLGLSASINTVDIPKTKVYDYLVRAIKKYNPNVPLKNVYCRIGFVKEPGCKLKFLFNNGSVSSEGVTYESKTKLHKKLNFYQIPPGFDENEDITQPVKNVFKLLDLSKKNRFIGLVPCLAPFRASATLLKGMEMNTWFFLKGRTQTFKTTVAQLCTSFYGPLQGANNLISWNSTDYALTGLALQARNGILGVDDFVYNPNSGKAKEFTDTAESFLRACANGTSRIRKDQKTGGIEDKGRLNLMTISTGEYAPMGVNESLLARGIFVPFARDDIDQDTLTRFQEMGENNDFVKVNIAFIQYLLKNRLKLNEQIKPWKQCYRKQLGVKFQSSPRTADQVIGMISAWRLFRMFAMSEGVIDNDQSNRYRKIVSDRLVSLLKKQKSIYLPSTGSIFNESLQAAFKEGRMHLIDHKDGGEPQIEDPSALGWKNGQPQGLNLGWYNDKTGTMFIRSDLPIEQLRALIPETYKKQFPPTVVTFWKKFDEEKLIVRSKDRLLSRAKLFGTNSEHYRLSQSIKV